MILAPAGNKNSFLAAIAAGADAIYCGLKIFSARMEADNFSIEELTNLTRLAHDRDVKVYVAFNSILKESELDKVFRILDKLTRYVNCDGLIVQDPAMVPLARKAGFEREIHVSTLGNLTFPAGMAAARKAGFSQVVLPREFTVDEIKEMAAHCPEDMSLEVFIHGALCYSVSGRCYWSSWFGGKSALRGRCVQPCRRTYQQKRDKKKHFSCMDFSADVLVKVLKDIPQVTTWKIEGRKKSPHYVFYTVKAYKMLRDEPSKKKEALAFLEYAMGREFSHYNLLPQRIQNPLAHDSETGSGMFLGRVKNPAEPYFITREALFPGDLLRIGNEEERYHDIQKVTRAIPKKGKFFLAKSARFRVKKGTAVHIIDRRGSELQAELKTLDGALSAFPRVEVRPGPQKNAPLPPAFRQKPSKKGPYAMQVSRHHQRGGKGKGRRPEFMEKGIWISTQRYSIKAGSRTWLWLDPVIFPKDQSLCEQYIQTAVKKGAKNFVLNAFWQIALFKNPERLNLWAGPYCNITNSMALHELKKAGFSGAIVSPELDQETFLSLPRRSPLPLGVVTKANWPLAISRIISPDLSLKAPFTSPRGEVAWITKSNDTYYTFPNWLLDLSPHQEELARAGYGLFVSMRENIPKGIQLKPRPGSWNWNLKLL
ncbi:MAG: U32 family peptidase [Desulfobacterales bacterium]|nr:U32 family peptidase [Desulfobacterales bacterium]